MEQQTKTNLLNAETWIRLLYMVVFGFLSVVARIVVWVVAVLQFLLVLITGDGNGNLRDLGQGASKWTYQAFLFLTFNSDEKPFPFSAWPEIDPPMESGGEVIDIDVAEDVSGISEPEVASDSVSTGSESPDPADADDVPTFVDEDEDTTKQGDKPE